MRVLPWDPEDERYASEADYRNQRGFDDSDVLVARDSFVADVPSGLRAVSMGWVGAELRALGEAGKLREMRVFVALDREFGTEDLRTLNEFAPELIGIQASYCSVDDEGLALLAEGGGFPNLAVFEGVNIPVSEGAVTRLFQARPELAVAVAPRPS